MPPFLSSPLDHVKHFHVWTFDDNMGRWSNDPSNWNQKWQLDASSNAVCLMNTPVEEENDAVDDMPWLSFGTRSTEGKKTSTESRLWSPPIPSAAGMRCLTLAYNINVANGSLRLLQRQEG